MAELTRKEFSDLAETCREHALDLARLDQHRVSLRHCYDLNPWFAQVKTYEPLRGALHDLRPARPISRWQVMALGAAIGLLALIALPASEPRLRLLVYVYTFGLILLYFVPERIYGTTVEMLEGKVLRVVEALERVLQSGEMGFTDAVFFQVKENLDDARRELRQQIDLAHRRR